MNRSDMTKSKSLPERRQPMITFSFEPQTSNAGFPDIAKLGDQKSDNTTMRKKKKRGRKGKHAQSKSTSACGEDQPMVIIRVSSEKNVDRRLLGGRGLAMDLSPKNSLLNMSETTTIPMTDAKESDDLLFAEVNAEIEQRKSGLIDLEQQLDALGMEDFNMEFDNNLLQTKQNQSNFTKRHSALVDKLEFDIGDLAVDDEESDTDGISSSKIQKLLWSGLSGHGD